MTFDDRMKYFSRPMYKDIFTLLVRVMRERPDLDDPFVIECAAQYIRDAADGGAELSVEDAVTLANHRAAPDTEKIVSNLRAMGFDTARDILDADAMRDAPEPFHGETKNPDAVVRVYLLQEQGKELGREPGCILMGLPKFDPEENRTRLVVAVTETELTREAQLLLLKLKLNASRSDMKTENGVAWLQFYVEPCWKD